MNVVLLLADIALRFLRYKLRSLFMMLGILLGVFTLVSAISLAGGFRVAVLDYFAKTFLPNNLMLTADPRVPGAKQLTLADIQSLQQALPPLQLWTPILRGGGRNLGIQGRSLQTYLSGVSADARLVLGQDVVSGSYFSEQDIRNRERVVLLGRTVREALFPDGNAEGQLLNIDNLVFVVQGELAALGADPHGGDLDNAVLLPYSTLQQMSKRDDLGSVRFLAAEGADVEATAQAMRSLLRQRHNIGSSRQDDFMVATSPPGMQAFQQFEELFRLLLPLVVGVIFLVSTLVIASLMLVNVKSRTAEIGLRKAVGARHSDILCQFLLEVLLLAALAGVLGVGLSYPALYYVQANFAALGSAANFMPTPTVLVSALLCALLTGLLASLWPAWRAAALMPKETLR